MATRGLQVATQRLRKSTTWLTVEPPGGLPPLSANRLQAATKLLLGTRQILIGLDDERLHSFLGLWPANAVLLPPANGLGHPDSPLPVLQWLTAATAAAPAFAQQVFEQLLSDGLRLPWRQTYAAGEAQSAFLERYGWCEFIGPRGIWPAAEFACGCLLLGPETLYPPHRHEVKRSTCRSRARLHGSNRAWTGSGGRLAR